MWTHVVFASFAAIFMCLIRKVVFIIVVKELVRVVTATRAWASARVRTVGVLYAQVAHFGVR